MKANGEIFFTLNGQLVGTAIIHNFYIVFVTKINSGRLTQLKQSVPLYPTIEFSHPVLIFSNNEKSFKFDLATLPKELNAGVLF